MAVISELEKKQEEEYAVPEHEPDAALMEGLYGSCEFEDDISGASLDRKEVIKARLLEMKFFKNMQVYTKIPREPGMKVITTKWLDVNKGDAEKPNIRSRLVGRELNLSKRDDLFAGTPPLESLRYIVSRCASRRGNLIMAIDVKRAYFYAPVTRDVFIEIPADDFQPGDEHRVARLNLSLYGTRDAAQNWVKAYTDVMVKNGFSVGRYSAQNFWHPERQLAVSVHGDDFFATGSETDLKWLEKVLSEAFEIKVEILGPGPSHSKEIRILNRVLTWHDWGIGYEADPRHAEIAIEQLGLKDAKPVGTPGTKADQLKAHEENGEDLVYLDPNGLSSMKNAGASPPRLLVGPDEVAIPTRLKEEACDEKMLTGENATAYRAVCARLNYLSQDRPDVCHQGGKPPYGEPKSWGPNPTKEDWTIPKGTTAVAPEVRLAEGAEKGDDKRGQ
jgi:hypothetical protein